MSATTPVVTTNPQPPASAPDPAGTPTPTITHYKQLADNFLKALDDIIQTLPTLDSSHPVTETFVNGHQNISLEFLSATVAAVEQTPELDSVRKLDVIGGYDTLQFLQAFTPVADRVSVFDRSLRFTMASRRANLSNQCLQVYQIAKGIARDVASAHVLAIVRNLKRILGRRGGPKTKASAASKADKGGTAPAPAPTATIAEPRG